MTPNEETLNAAMYTMRFYADKMSERELTEYEVLAYEQICRVVESSCRFHRMVYDEQSEQFEPPAPEEETEP
jgi:hypothetical protein